MAKAYLDSNNLELSAIFAIPIVITFKLLGRQKKPTSRSFNCAKCKKIERFDSRTISAWNSGFARLYCNRCHIQWLRNNHQQQDTYSSPKSGGCLGAFALIFGTTFWGGYTIVDWLMQTVI